MQKIELPVGLQRKPLLLLAEIFREQTVHKTVKQLVVSLLQSKHQDEWIKQAKRAWRTFAPVSKAVKGRGRPSDKDKLYTVIRDWYHVHGRTLSDKVSAYRLEQHVNEHFKQASKNSKVPSNSAIRKYVRLWLLEQTPPEQLKQADLKWLSQVAPPLARGIKMLRKANQISQKWS